MGRILHIDLTHESTSEYPWTNLQRIRTLGGKAAAFQILSDHLTGSEQPFSEENWIILSTGPLTGTGAPGSSRFEITALSPKTGLPASSNCGGNFGVFLKKAGYDALILSGRCRSCRWLEIREDAVRFHDAAPLWGLKTVACKSRLDERMLQKPYGYLCIGPAGEDLLPFATVISDGRAAGRAGLGAVLGWKRLKAIVVSGKHSVTLYDREQASSAIRQWNQLISRHPLTSDPGKISSCSGCPVRCKKESTKPDPMLNDLGLDAMEAAAHSQWLRENYGYTPALSAGNPHGQRRNKLYHTMLDYLALPDRESCYRFNQNLTEALSAMGLCVFVSGTCIPAQFCKTADCQNQDPSLLLRHCTGISISAEQLLAVGANCLVLQENLLRRFEKRV